MSEETTDSVPEDAENDNDGKVVCAADRLKLQNADLVVRNAALAVQLLQERLNNAKRSLGEARAAYSAEVRRLSEVYDFDPAKSQMDNTTGIITPRPDVPPFLDAD